MPMTCPQPKQDRGGCDGLLVTLESTLPTGSLKLTAGVESRPLHHQPADETDWRMVE